MATAVISLACVLPRPRRWDACWQQDSTDPRPIERWFDGLRKTGHVRTAEYAHPSARPHVTCECGLNHWEDLS